MNLETIKNNLINSINMGKNSHAFLFVTNNIEETYKMIIDVLISVNCINKGINCNCNICNTIKKNTNPDIITIKPEGKEIKKESIENLIYRFMGKPLFNKFSSYIIINSDKLNITSSNKILKFLEEPDGNIIGFFITDNVNSMLPTIKSRCSIINTNYNGKNLLDILNINSDTFDKYYESSLEFLNILNITDHYKLMKDSKKYSKKERIDIENILEIVKSIYTIKFEYLTSNKYDNDSHIKNIIDIISNNDINIIVKRIKMLDNILSDFKFNVNKDLFINKLFICWE